MLTSRRGFTLYEVLLVLVLTAGLLLLLAKPATVARASLAERAFWPAWQRLWQAGRQVAMREHRPLEVTIADQTGHVELWTTTRMRRRLRAIPIPPGIHRVTSSAETWQITPTGWAPAQTIEWRSTATNRWWYQRFQLGGSLFYVQATRYRQPTVRNHWRP